MLDSQAIIAEISCFVKGGFWEKTDTFRKRKGIVKVAAVGETVEFFLPFAKRNDIIII